MENHENLIGKILSGRYKIEAIVGEGGMSVVMKAYDALKMREVTIKLLSLKNSGDQNAVERFTNEAKAIAMLSHPNIVSVYDVSLEGASKYIVMEYINGITLKEYLDRKGRLNWPEAVHYVNQVLAALSHAHEKGIIHRDIKPENVMLMRNGSIKVIDFGIAKLPDSKSLTVIDKAIGTVNYISPEQASGSISTEKSDIYSTGIMLYELVTGQLPFVSASSVSVAMMHVSSEPALPSSICDSIPTGLEQIIIKAMMKDPEKRFGSAIAMKKALEYLTAYPATIFREKNAVTADGKPILSTGAPSNNGNNTVITKEISPIDADEEQEDTENLPDDTDSIDEEDEEEGYVKQSVPSMLPIVLGVTLAFFTVLFITGIVAYNTYYKPSTTMVDDNVEVPQLVNKEFNKELHDSLVQQGFKVTVKHVFNENVESGHIVHQTPLAGSTRKPNKNGIPLELEVSQGTSETVLKDYSHYNYANVKLSLQSLKLKVEVKEEFHDTVVIDHIIRTEPAAGSILFEGDTVTLYVSKGPDDLFVEIPQEILGQRYDKAEQILQDLGIKITAERGREYSDEYPVDTVIRTEPATGTMVSVNTDTVKIILSNGSDPLNTAIATGGNGDAGGAGFQQVDNEVIVGNESENYDQPEVLPTVPTPETPSEQPSAEPQPEPTPEVQEPPAEVAPGSLPVHGKKDENSSDLGSMNVTIPLS